MVANEFSLFIFIFWFDCFFIFLPICSIKRNNESMLLGWSGDGEDLGRDQGRETMIRIYHMENCMLKMV